MNMNEFTSRLEGVKGSGNKCMACCPAHNDKEPSLSVTEENGRILMNCFAGCTRQQIIKAMGLTEADFLKPYEPDRVTTYGYPPYLRKRRNMSTKKIWWEHLDERGEWINNSNGMAIPLYNQDAIADVEPDGTVYFVEGEKDCESLKRLGLVATTLPSGAGSEWKREYTKLFENKKVVILPDNDKAGRGYAERIAQNLFGVASGIKILVLTDVWKDLAEKGDITDVVEMQGNDVEVVEKLQALEAATPEFSIFDEPPKPLIAVEIPRFPVDCLPKVVAEYVKAVAENTQTALEMSGTLALGVLATTMQGKCVVQISQSYKEQTSLFTVAVADSGERKSAVMRHMTASLSEFEVDFNRSNKAEFERNKSEKRVLEGRIKRLEARAESGNIEAEEQLELNANIELLANFRELRYLRLLVGDATPEKIIDLMDEQGGRITICSAEGGIFDMLTAKNDRSTTLIEPLLKGYSGDRLVVDRMTRKSNIINKPHVSIILSVQPHLVYRFMANEMYRDRGLVARFLFVKCGSYIGERSAVSADIPNETQERYNKLVSALLSLTGERVLTLSDEAEQERQRFYDEVEKRLVSEWSYLRDFGAKFMGVVARIAGLIHAAENVGGGEFYSNVITGETFRRAIELAEYFGKHAELLYLGGGLCEAVGIAKYVLDRVEQSGKSKFAKSELQNLCQKFKNDDLMIGLELLEEHNFVKTVKAESGERGRPSEVIFFNTK